MPYRRCPRCGVSSYVAPVHTRPAVCPSCDRPLPPPEDPAADDREREG